MRTRRHFGFSLIELVIVIIILAVISAIALPRIGRGAKGADESAVSSNLAVLRSALELYAAEHGGTFPGAAADGSGNAAGTPEAFETQLTKFSDKSGNVSDVKDTATGKIYGPYLHKIPPMTVGGKAGNAGVKVVTGGTVPVVDASADAGWVYNASTGQLIANCDDASDDGTTYDTW